MYGIKNIYLKFPSLLETSFSLDSKEEKEEENIFLEIVFYVHDIQLKETVFISYLLESIL